MSYYDSSGQGEMALTKPYSEQTAELIDKEVKRLLDDAFALATKVLREHRDGFTQLAELLLERKWSSPKTSNASSASVSRISNGSRRRRQRLPERPIPTPCR